MRVPAVGEEFGRYRLDRVIGQGGMGVVFAATDLRLDRTVAVKVITGGLASSPDFRARFQAEAAALARLDSPYVIAIHDHDEIDETPYIVTQYVAGTDLATALREHGPMTARDALRLCAQLARGLGDAHRAGVIHRDVKPGNVLLRDPGSPDQHAYLCDFGIARAEGVEATAPTATGMVAGTWSYLAPERAAGSEATPASDIYALGCVLWACLTGHEPYRGNDAQVVLAHQQAPVPRLPGDSAFIAEVNAVIGRALAKSPADRYADAALLRADLERLAAQAPTDTVEGAVATAGPLATVVRGSPPAVQPPSQTSPARRRRWPVLVAAIVVLLVAAGGLTWLLGRDDDGECCPPDPVVDTVRGDIDGDAHGDLTLVQNRRGSGTHLATWTVPSNGKSFGTPVKGEPADGVLLLADVDGDGRTDQVWGDAYASSTDGTELTLTIKPGDEKRAEQTTQVPIEPGAINFFSTVVLDLDADGRDDLAAYSVDSDSGRASVWAVLAGDDGFGDAEQWYAGEADYGSAVVAGDFDGDGADELIEVLAHDDDPTAYDLRVLRPAEGSADLIPGEAITIHGRTLGLSGSFAADTDGDGADEVVIPGAGGQRILAAAVVDGVVRKPHVAWQSSQQASAEEYGQNLFDYGSSSWAIADLDGDGDDDLIHVDDIEGEDPNRVSTFGLTVFTADTGRYDGPQLWGRFPCASECGDDYRVIASAR